MFVWYSRKQRTTATSTTEAEYIGLSNAGKVAVWIRKFLYELRMHDMIDEPVTVIGNRHSKAIRLIGDNMGSLALVKNPEFHARTKHIDVQYHHIRELAEDGVVKLEHCRTEDMAADCLTKPLTKSKFTAGIGQLGMKQRPLIGGSFLTSS